MMDIEKRLERIENALIIIAECIKSGEYESVPILVQAVLFEAEEKDGEG
jgi:hypothetical protein